MARSFKKNQIIGITSSESDSPYKREFQSRSRAYERNLLHKLKLDHEYEVDGSPIYNPWFSPKDGKRWVSDEEAKSNPSLLRK